VGGQVCRPVFVEEVDVCKAYFASGAESVGQVVVFVAAEREGGYAEWVGGFCWWPWFRHDVRGSVEVKGAERISKIGLLMKDDFHAVAELEIQSNNKVHHKAVKIIFVTDDLQCGSPPFHLQKMLLSLYAVKPCSLPIGGIKSFPRTTSGMVSKKALAVKHFGRDGHRYGYSAKGMNILTSGITRKVAVCTSHPRIYLHSTFPYSSLLNWPS
jgi:hypothetical protein